MLCGSAASLPPARGDDQHDVQHDVYLVCDQLSYERPGLLYLMPVDYCHMLLLTSITFTCALLFNFSSSALIDAVPQNSDARVSVQPPCDHLISFLNAYFSASCTSQPSPLSVDAPPADHTSFFGVEDSQLSTVKLKEAN